MSSDLISFSGQLLDRMNVFQGTIDKLSDQISANSRISEAKYDVSAFKLSKSFETDVQETLVLTENVTTFNSMLADMNNSLNASYSLAEQINVLVMRAKNSTLGSNDRKDIATEISSVVEQIVIHSKKKFNGRSLFGAAGLTVQSGIDSSDSLTVSVMNGGAMGGGSIFGAATQSFLQGGSLFLYTSLPGSLITAGISLDSISDLVSRAGVSADASEIKAAKAATENLLSGLKAMIGNVANGENKVDFALSALDSSKLSAQSSVEAYKKLDLGGAVFQKFLDQQNYQASFQAFQQNMQNISQMLSIRQLA